jgi:hypothetical protein
LSDALIVAVLAVVTAVGAALSFVAWHRLSRRPPRTGEKSQFDSDDPGV